MFFSLSLCLYTSIFTLSSSCGQCRLISTFRMFRSPISTPCSAPAHQTVRAIAVTIIYFNTHVPIFGLTPIFSILVKKMNKKSCSLHFDDNKIMYLGRNRWSS